MRLKSILLICLVFSIALSLAGCTVKVQPALSPSLGMKVFEDMKELAPRDVVLALYIEPKLKNLKLIQRLRNSEYYFDIGDAFCAKLIKAISYKFKTIILIDIPKYEGKEPIDALMRVGLQDIDASMSIKHGFYVVSKNYIRLSVKAEIRDAKKNKVVWVGTAHVDEASSQGDIAMTYQQAGRIFAASINQAIDKAIGSLLRQMSKSNNLELYIMRWEKRGGVRL